jgi:1-acyl-sn-glycerol-3-phosphate acyltransferase
MSEVIPTPHADLLAPAIPGESARNVLRSVARRWRNRAKLFEQRIAAMHPVDELQLRAVSMAKITTGCAALAAGGMVQGGILLALLPSRRSRIRACNYWGKVIGRFFMHLSGSPLTIEGTEHLDRDRPAIYVSNHSSVVDIFLAIWLSPVGTVGIAKKEIALYPIFGQLYFLSGHLLIDRGHSDRAVSSLRKLAAYVRRHKLSIFLWPEGTRSRSGRLQPFKKGVVHLAMQTGLPVVPIVVRGAHRSWSKDTYTVRPTPISVLVLPPVATDQWTEDGMDEALEKLRACFLDNLPNEQQPLPEESANAIEHVAGA